MGEYHIPGVAFVLVKDGQLFFAKGYGYTNLENRIPIIPEETDFCASSVANEDPRPETKNEDKEESARNPIDMTVEVVDSSGEISRLPLSHFSLLQPQLEGQLGKAKFMSPFPTSETVLQHFEFSLADFVAANAAFDPAGLVQVRFLFDRTEAGVIVLDNVGFRN